MQIESLETAVKVVTAGLRVLNQRLLTMIALFLCAFLFGWVMLDPKWERIVAATLFAIAAWFLTRFGGPQPID